MKKTALLLVLTMLVSVFSGYGAVFAEDSAPANGPQEGAFSVSATEPTTLSGAKTSVFPGIRSYINLAPSAEPPIKFCAQDGSRSRISNVLSVRSAISTFPTYPYMVSSNLSDIYFI